MPADFVKKIVRTSNEARETNAKRTQRTNSEKTRKMWTKDDIKLYIDELLQSEVLL